MSPWRAGCGENRTSGSEGGSEKPTDGDAGTALRPDPYDWVRTYDAGDVGSFKTFVVPVGREYTGSGFHLVFVNDKDSGSATNTGRFRNVRVYELE